ncbi:MAG: caspase family protein [Flavobacteriales bacterium]|nr:caspase family protein [Flavobacteriales bacterium]
MSLSKLLFIATLLLITHRYYPQEYFESFMGEEVHIPAYSEYYQDRYRPERDKVFLGTYTEGIIQYQTTPVFAPIDTIRCYNGYLKAFDYQPFSNYSEELMAIASSEKELIIYDLQNQEVLLNTTLPNTLNDVQFSNIDPHIIWAADASGYLIQYNWVEKRVDKYQVHSKGIARIELFLDKIITSSFDHTIKVHHQKTLAEEQSLKCQIPPLEFDVSVDGILAIAAAKGVALYSIIDQKWLYGKELLNKKVKAYEGDSKKYYWNPYLNDDESQYAGSTQKITFLRHGHTIAYSNPYQGLWFTELNDPSLLVRPYAFQDSLITAEPKYIFNQDNHLSFYAQDYGFDEYLLENPPYVLQKKATYIDRIDPEHGLKRKHLPFDEIVVEGFDFDLSYSFDPTGQRGPSSFVTLDNLYFSKDTNYAYPVYLSMNHIEHLIPFPAKEEDLVAYSDEIGAYLGAERFDMCYEDLENYTIDPLCVLENTWMTRDTSTFYKQDESFSLYSYLGEETYEQLEVRDLVIRNIVSSAMVYKHGVQEEPKATQEAADHRGTTSQLYMDDAFIRMDQKGHLSAVESFAISPDQKYLATGGQDTKIILWDFHTGVKLKELDYSKINDFEKYWQTYETDWEFSFTFMTFHPTQSWIIASTRYKGSICLDYQTGKIIGQGNSFEYATLSDDGRFVIDDQNNLYTLPNMIPIDSYEGDYMVEKPMVGNNKVIARPKDKNLSVYTDSYRGSELELIEQNMQKKSDGSRFDLLSNGFVSPNGNWFVSDSVIYDKKNNECYNLEGYPKGDYNYAPVYLKGDFSPDHKYFAYPAYKKIKLFNLETKQFSTIIDTTVYKFEAPVRFSADSKYLVSRVWEIKGGELNWLEEANTNRTLGIYDVTTLHKFRHHTGHPVEPMQVRTDSSMRYLLFQGVGFLYLLDRETLEIQQLKIKQESFNYSVSYGSSVIRTTTEGDPVVYGELSHDYSNGTTRFEYEWQPHTGIFKRYFEDETGIDFYENNSPNLYITRDWRGNWDNDDVLWEISDLRDISLKTDTSYRLGLDTTAYLKVLENNKTGELKISGSFNYEGFNSGAAFAITPDHQYIYLPTSGHGIGKYTLPDMKLVTKWDAHEEHPLMIQLMGTEMLTIGNDGNVILWDLSTPIPSERLRFYGDQEGLFMITPAHYYSATKDNIDFVGFRKGNNFIPISSFDMKFNRPDIILKALGSHQSALIETYKVAYDKRLKRMNIQEVDLEIEKLPVLRIENLEYLPKFTNDGTLEIIANCNTPLENIRLWVNGVAQTTSITPIESGYSFTVELVNGMNEIELKGVTSTGNSTLPVQYTLERNSTKTSNNLYVLSIGVSEYMDSTFNLGYAAKDAKDVSSVFTQLENFDTVSNFTLLNEDVTSEALSEIQEYLDRATINDIVVIYVAGHGLLDENFDYYYAVHDVDFNHPATKGWSYDLFEKLISQSKANKKLLLFDTCHGGEIDKEELALNETEQTEDGDVAFRASKTFNYLAQPTNASELSKSFFGDFRKGVGATVIASSGGAEYAAESDIYKNGIFTYFLRKGLTANEADLNGDHQITVNELRIYLNEEVRKATNGKQNPGTRIVNDKHEMVLKVY